MVSQEHKTALDDACTKAKAGTRSQEVFDDDTITVEITSRGGVQVTVKDRRNFDAYSREGQARSTSRSVIETRPVIADPEFTFLPA